MTKQCPMCFNIPPEQGNDGYYDCMESRCAWYCEDAQKCALLVIADSERKVAKAK